MSSEPDLYPPDVEHVTPEMKQAQQRAFLGGSLLTFGIGLMLERAFSADYNFFFLAIGVGILAAWSQAPRFALFAIGAILTGLSAGDFVNSMLHVRFESFINFAFDTAGFFAVYARYPFRAKWALFPAAFFGLLAVASVGVELLGLIPAALSGVLLPLLLIAAGALLLGRNSLPSPIVKGGLVLIAIAFVASASSSIDGGGGRREFNVFASEGASKTFSTPLPDLEGRTLVVETNSGAVSIVAASEGAGGQAIAKARARRDMQRGAVEVDTDGDTVTLSLASPGFNSRSVDWSLIVPRGTDIRATVDDGPISAVLWGGDVELRSDDGPVTAILHEGGGSLNVNTDDGHVRVHALGETDPALHLETDDGRIMVGSRVYGDVHRATGPGADVSVTTDDGSITIVNA